MQQDIQPGAEIQALLVIQVVDDLQQRPDFRRRLPAGLLGARAGGQGLDGLRLALETGGDFGEVHGEFSFFEARAADSQIGTSRL